jgi:hypothetical protein
VRDDNLVDYHHHRLHDQLDPFDLRYDLYAVVVGTSPAPTPQAHFTFHFPKIHLILRISNKYTSVTNCFQTMTQPNNYVLEGGASNRV